MSFQVIFKKINGLFLVRYHKSKRAKPKPVIQVNEVARAAPVAANFGMSTKFRAILISPRITALAEQALNAPIFTQYGATKDDKGKNQTPTRRMRRRLTEERKL